MINLKKNEQLVYAGDIALRAPNGALLPAVPQYMIVSIDDADSAYVTALQDNERLILAGRVFNGKKRAEERFAALKAGIDSPPLEVGIPLYFKTDSANVNPKTGFTYEHHKALEALAEDLTKIYAMQMRKAKAFARQGKNKTNIKV